ncbi:MAG: SAM-dependent methyltransferase [Pseudonocardiales bacterium]|nr:MAG: SAM-dependent methyltransferase [Pseudonocardiales bacterium]
MSAGPDESLRRLVASPAADDVTSWFERLYIAADRGEAVVPWDRGGPNPTLVEWAASRPSSAAQALVVGVGLGDDAEFVAALGYATTAFDVSPTAIRSARERFPRSAVSLAVADLLDPPPEWRGAFDLVVESLTVQSMPRSVREAATRSVGSFVGVGGTLLVIATELGDGDPSSGPPWPLTRAEIEAFAGGGVRVVGIELLAHPHDSGARRWVGEFRRS